MPIVQPTSEFPLALDTCVLTHLQNRHQYAMDGVKEYQKNTKQYPAITAITVFEKNFGTQNSLVKGHITGEQAESYQTRLQGVVGLSKVLEFNEAAAEIAAYISARLTKKEQGRLLCDLFIVSTVLAHHYGLATQNRKDMEQIGACLPDNQFFRLAIWK